MLCLVGSWKVEEKSSSVILLEDTSRQDLVGQRPLKTSVEHSDQPPQAGGAGYSRIRVSRRDEGLLGGELQGKCPEAKQAGMSDNYLALSNAPEGASESSFLGAVTQDLLAAGGPVFAQDRPSCSRAGSPHGCHSSVARLVHLWAHEAML